VSDGRWLRVATVAEELDVSMRTVLRWIDTGELKAIRLPGGQLRVAQRDLDQVLERWASTEKEAPVTTTTNVDVTLPPGDAAMQATGRGCTLPLTDASGPARLSPPGPGKEV
jgi:excisionase family DNA binding protein